MANAIERRPISIDTADAGALTSDVLRMLFVYWINPTTIGHTFIIQDAAGNEVTRGRCEVANESQLVPLFVTKTGLLVPTLGSGELLIHLA